MDSHSMPVPNPALSLSLSSPSHPPRNALISGRSRLLQRWRPVVQGAEGLRGVRQGAPPQRFGPAGADQAHAQAGHRHGESPDRHLSAAGSVLRHLTKPARPQHP